MHFTRPLARPKNLLLCFDAFDTLYKPNITVPVAYAFAATRHGINCVTNTTASKPVQEWKVEDCEPVFKAFKQSYRHEDTQNPNYGKATGLGAEKWWANVIRGTFQPFLKSQQKVPETLISELLKRYSSREGYDLFPDAKTFFDNLRTIRSQPTRSTRWKWNKIIVGVITNSDDRVPSVLSSFGLKVSPRRVGTSAQSFSEATSEDDIDFVVLSYDVGYNKPDSRMFDAAGLLLSETLASAPSSSGLGSVDDYEKLYVGDSLTKDYLGARKAGWHAVLIDRMREKGQESGKKGERRPALDTKRMEVNGQPWNVRLVRGLDELVNWHPKNKSTSEPMSTSWFKSGDGSESKA
ncbi:haloacid dehalogenase [Bimuria novae-zelandiae CBS 107.79]|uniref:Haloacid dehalogenase n=1 Tax=Bimuria novae-zelandiae CBS 107.79 TaxID=1447943 RepID=A0A6A5VEA4_9PLEO|nr:haloacid dehalogenase [Bimuria novae-zelandiae CBS 107.79]